MNFMARSCKESTFSFLLLLHEPLMNYINSNVLAYAFLLMSVRRTSFKDSSTYRSVFTACLLFGDWAYADVLTSITLLSPE